MSALMALAQSVLGSVQGIAAFQGSATTQSVAGPSEKVHLFRPSRSSQQGGESLCLLSVSLRGAEGSRRRVVQCRATVYKVEMIHEGKSYVLDVPEGETILEVALDNGLEVPHDCKLGVCMTCPAKLETGTLDQSGGMLSDDVIERGYALMCVAYPQTDCTIRTIPEEELLSLQLATANDA